MTVRLRLQRHGAKKRPFYRIVAADKRSTRDGRFIEQLGTFDPLQEPPAIRLNTERANYWLSTGASPSQTVATLIRKVSEGAGVDLAAENADRQAAAKRRADKEAALEQRRADAIKAHHEASKAEEAAKAAPAQTEAPAEATAAPGDDTAEA